jgi:hypothetical protein
MLWVSARRCRRRNMLEYDDTVGKLLVALEDPGPTTLRGD